MLDQVRFAAYRGGLGLATWLSFRSQRVPPLRPPAPGPIPVRPFAEAYPDLPIPGLYDPAGFPAEDRGRLRRVAASARLVHTLQRLAPERTPAVPADERGFLAAVYPRLFRAAWPSPPRVPPPLRPGPDGSAPDVIAALAVAGPFASALRAATAADVSAGRAPEGAYVVDLSWFLPYPPRPGLLAPGGLAVLQEQGGVLRTSGLWRGAEQVPLRPWEERQLEREALLAAWNEELNTFRHNVSVHLATLTPFAVASAQALPVDHPVRRLLHHCFHTVLIGNRELATLQLSGPRGFGARIFSHGPDTLARMAAEHLSRYDFWDFEPDTQFARRGTTRTPFDYPYRDNVLHLWGITLGYVRRYLGRYLDDERLAADRDLQAWFTALDRLLLRPAWTGGPPTADRLARLCATVIHLSTVEHDILNNLAWDYATPGWIVPTVVPASGERMDRRRAFELITTLIVTWKPYAMLLTAGVPALAPDPAGRVEMARWIDELRRVQDEMAAQGVHPWLSYPANLNVSVSN